MIENENINSIKLDGGTLCLDYTNTVHDRKSETQPDYLYNTADLIAWAAKAGILDTAKANFLEAAATASNEKAAFFFEEAINLRELLYRIFYAITQGKNIATADLTHFNQLLQRYFQNLVLGQNQGTYSESWDIPSGSFYAITAPIVRDAYHLLLSDRLHRIKECPNCGWLFLDRTKNGKRRWCSMESCGSNAKALTWYHRHKLNK